MIFDVKTPDFRAEVLERSKTSPVVVLFWAEWCGPCKQLKPLLMKLAAELPFNLARVDAGTERDLAAQENVRAVPNVRIYRDGTPVDGFSGARTEAQLRAIFENAGIATSLEFD